MINARLGIDLGNGYTKYNGKMFKTRTKTGKLLKVGTARSNVHEVIYNGRTFVVGDGEMLTGETKYNDIRYKLCLLTAIIDSVPHIKNINAKICVGMPILDHDRLKSAVESEILSWGIQSICVNGTEYTVHIKEVDVFIEGALPILQNDTSNTITIDIGSGTINTVEWDNMSPIKYDTMPKSFYRMYSDIATYLNDVKGGNFTVEDVEKIIINNRTVTPINQVPTDISEIYDIVEDFVSGSASLIRQKFSTGQVEKIQLLGGGASATYDYWLKQFPKILLVEDCQHINSKVYDMVAKL